ncbi:MAG: DUF5652 family protein [Candidatus Nanoarchaeia archaeon]
MLGELAALVATFGVLLFIAMIWEMVWKGIALWYAAKDDHKVWYVCLLIFNTLGILPIVYLLIHRQKDVNKVYKQITAKKKRR